MTTGRRRTKLWIERSGTARVVVKFLGSLACLLVACPAVMAIDPPTNPAVGSTDDTDTSQDDEASPFQSGLVAHYRGADGSQETRLEEAIAFSWGEQSPSRRLAPGPFSVRFSGQLQVQQPGTYRLRAHAAEHLRLVLGGKVLLDTSSPQAAWLGAQPVELPFGFHPLEVEYRRTSEPARVALFWEGPQFALEPLAARWLFHETASTPDATAQRGADLVRALRCAACHELPGEPRVLPAASLTHLAGNVSRAWLIDWLVTPSAARAELVDAAESVDGERAAGVRRMPHFGFAPADAVSVADALLTASKSMAEAPMPPGKPVDQTATVKKTKADKTPAPAPPTTAAGSALAKTLGCLACHRLGPLGRDGLFGGGDLVHVADKRPADFFARWLADPARVNADHRMPVFALDTRERESLALYLQTLSANSSSPPAVRTDPPAGSIDRGWTLVRAAGCAQCHALPKAAGIERNTQRTKLTPAALAREADQCLAESGASAHRPRYVLNASDRAAIRAYLVGLNAGASPETIVDGGRLLRENNCLGCHARGHGQGLAAQLPALAEAEPRLRDVLPALAPPSLSGIGDKLLDDALLAAINARGPTRQAWLKIRMPRFSWSAEQASAIARHFIEADRIPDRADSGEPPRAASPQAAPASDATLEAAGARLVTAEGFGCTSCHAIGKWQPQKVTLAAHGSDLSEIGGRVRPAWFERWVRNPARLQPQMEMPAVQQSVRGVLEGNLDRQLAAVWRVLNRPGFTPPSPNALRVVRRANVPEVVERAAVLTDLIEVDGRPVVRPLVIGLANRHNVMLDSASNRLAAWWIGDTARQQTRGKSWYWEAGVPQLLLADKPAASEHLSELQLIRGDQTFRPLQQGQYVTEVDEWKHADGRLDVAQRLVFSLDDQPHTVRVVQRFSPLATGAPSERSGFKRLVKIAGLPANTGVEFLALAGEAKVDADGRRATVAGRGVTLAIALEGASRERFIQTSRGAAIVVKPSTESPTLALVYTADVVVDPFVFPPPLDRSVTGETIAVVPGFEGVRLPVTDQAMPTGLAWRPDGTLIVTSLEGRVWLGHDTDGDGLEDRLDPFSDELATPWGAAANGESIDVINKTGLLRLTDRDGDGHAEHSELLASGWGHTLDYHDWAVGLPRDTAGNYYVSLPCQQDERSEEGATLRGTVIRLVPREPNSDDPRQFTIDPLCGGLRFPQGIALSSDEELFVTDNQGNYTPFNELNHVVRGARYGFINKLESKRGLAPPFRPAAVEIPHPWTRSVNGIRFLRTPPAVIERLGCDPFGPWAGHLVGCEYDTRRLVRMSLERVAGDFQGAVYPMSREPAAGEETFEGPLCCAVAPDGALYVGNIRDSGWGAGSNTGSLVRLRPKAELPPGIAEVRLARDGFTIHFTQPVDPARATQVSNYTLASYRRTPTPNYGGPDQDRRVEKVKSIELAKDGRQSLVRVDELREGFVYEIRLRNLVAGNEFFPAEAYYTLRKRWPEKVAAPANDQ